MVCVVMSFSVGSGWAHAPAVSVAPSIPQKATYGGLYVRVTRVGRVRGVRRDETARRRRTGGGVRGGEPVRRVLPSWCMASVDGKDVVTSVGTRIAVTDARSVRSSRPTPRWSRAVTTWSVARSTRDWWTRWATCGRGRAGWRPSARGRSSWRRRECSTAAARPPIGGTPAAVARLPADQRRARTRSSCATATIYTSAGVSAGIDLALALVEYDHGADLVRDVARSLVVYLKRAGGQSQFSALVEAASARRSTVARAHRGHRRRPRRTTIRWKTLAAQASLSKPPTDTAVPRRTGHDARPLRRDDPNRRRSSPRRR